MTTTASTPMPATDYTLQRLRDSGKSSIPAWLPAGVKLPLMGDLGRAVDAFELYLSLAAGEASWDLAYPELHFAADPQAAAVDQAWRAAGDEWASFATAVARAIVAVTR